MSKKLMRLLAIIFALALVATACGSDADEAANDVAEAADDAADDVEVNWYDT